MKNPLFQYVLSLADDALIIGQRLSEWAYRAPFLEEDIALSNISLDLFGRANLLLEYASEIKGGETSADDLAFKRNERDFFNHLLCEQPNGNFGKTIVRQLFFDSFYLLFLTRLAKSKDSQLAAISQKSLKEVTYHFRHSNQWVIRLGAGTKESHEKLQNAINELWVFTDEFFNMNDIDKIMVKQNIGVDRQVLQVEWDKEINKVLKTATLKRPEKGHIIAGGKEGIHSEHLGHLLSDMQYLQRTYPKAEW